MQAENIYYSRLCALREIMGQNGWEAVVLRGSDPHQSEYLAPRYQSITYLTGFTGEAADVVVTMDHAGLWTDSRYFIQAAKQLEGTGVSLHKTRLPESVGIPQWLAQQGCSVVAVDSLCESSESLDEIDDECCGIEGFQIVCVPDLIDVIWEDRPALPSSTIITLDESTVGMTRAQKIQWLRDCYPDCDYILVSELDQVAWMLNVRGGDIDYNPLVFSYLLVGKYSVQWFVLKGAEPDEETSDSFAQLQSEGISIELYDSIMSTLEAFANQQLTVAYDPATLNAHLCHFMDVNGIPDPSPIPLKKAVKTPEEIDGFREAHLEDGLAMEKFLYWLEQTIQEGPVSESEAAQRLSAFRAEIPGYRGDSFETISAWGPGAALPHYSTPKDGSTLIQPNGLYLCDSGGQYLFGTTDITRTVPMGELSQLQKEDYTLVLQGMINLSMAKFPYGTAGCQIDALARGPLWSAGRNFGHGTGHGVGFFLCVHEGPQSIRQNFLSQPLLPGMVTSNEPALYREGEWGIRHENVILCCEKGSNEFGRWLGFETLTCCHIDTSAVIADMLTPAQKQWLNNYNAWVYKNFAPAIEDEDFREWLKVKTLPLE